MAMQKSEELKDLISTVSAELSKLDLILDRCFINIIDPETLGMTWWMANPEIPTEPMGLSMRYHEHAPYQAHLNAWRDGKVKWVYVLEGAVKKDWDKFLFVETDLANLPPQVIEDMRSQQKVYLNCSFNKFGYLSLATVQPLTDEQSDIMVRFAKVFDLTYTRFNDLQQAEAQAREAQIEASLERVRAKAMAMHRSDDLNTVVGAVFEELDKLQLGPIRCGIAILDKEKPRGDIWVTIKTDQGNTLQLSGDEPLDIHPLLQGAYDAWLKHEDFSYVLQGDDLLKYYEVIRITSFQLPISSTFDSEQKDQRQHYFNAVFQDGSIFAFLDTDFTGEAKSVMKRFAKVFEQTYTRFLDLQKAEAQAKEAKIEAALEKVRSRSLAMHQSDELQEVVHTVIERLKELNVELYTAIIIIFSEDSKDIVWWLENTRNEQHPRILLKYADIPYLKDLFEAKEKGKELFSKCYVDNEKNKLYNYLFESTDLKQTPENQKKFLLENEFAAISVAFAKNTGIHITSYSKETFSEEENDILKRFAKVFDQAYTRFLDLQKAEAQAREAQIEASLERVRSKTMAMHNSQDVANTVSTMFDELVKLGIETMRCGVGIMDENYQMELWTARPDATGKAELIIGQLRYEIASVINRWI